MNNTKILILLFMGAIVALCGILTPGLWPWQLPASALGGGMFGFALNRLLGKTRKK